MVDAGRVSVPVVGRLSGPVRADLSRLLTAVEVARLLGVEVGVWSGCAPPPDVGVRWRLSSVRDFVQRGVQGVRKVLVPSGVLKGRTVVVCEQGDPCEICEGACRFPNCVRCGGHSEHNAGCDTL